MRRAYSIIFVLILILSGFSLLTVFDFTSEDASAVTVVSGQWASGTYSNDIFIVGTTNIPVGNTVIIQPPAMIQFNFTTSKLNIDGNLEVDGTKSSQIQIKPQTTSIDSIVINSTGWANFTWCQFQNLNNGIMPNNNNYQVQITNCSFTNCNKYLNLTQSKINVISTKFDGNAFEHQATHQTHLNKVDLNDANSQIDIQYLLNVYAVNGSSTIAPGNRANLAMIPGVKIIIIPADAGSIMGYTDAGGSFMYNTVTALKIVGTAKTEDYTSNNHTITAQDKWYGDPRQDKGGPSEIINQSNISYVANHTQDLGHIYIDSDLQIHQYFMFEYAPYINTTLPKVIVYEDSRKPQNFQIFDNDDDDLANNITFNITDQNGNDITDEFGPIDNVNKWIWYDFQNTSLVFLRTIESPFTNPSDYDAVKDETIKINVTDLLDHRASQTFTVEFHNVPDKPVIADLETATSYKVKEDVIKYIRINVSDNDNATSDIEITSDSPYVTYEYVSPTVQRLKLLFPNEFGANRIQQINLTATDNCIYNNIKNEVTYPFTISFEQSGDAPSIIGTIPDKSGTEIDWDPKLTLDTYWSDPDPDETADDLKWYATDVDDTYFNVTGDQSTANNPLNFIWEYEGDLGGARNPQQITDTVTIWLRDKYGLTDSQEITLTVNSTNKQPSLHRINFKSVEPEVGDNEHNYIFKIEYKDEDGAKGDAPEYVKVYIDGEAYDMVEKDVEDDDYTDGKEYIYTTKLAPGNHEHYFECSDSKLVTRHPEGVATHEGPQVGVKIYVGEYKSTDGNIIAKIAYSGSDGTAMVQSAADPNATHNEHMGDMGFFFKINPADMLTIEWIEVKINFGSDFSNYESRWLRKEDMRLAYFENNKWNEFMISTVNEKQFRLTCNISGASYQTILENILDGSKNPILTVVGTLDADNDVLYGGRYNDEDAFPFDPAARDDSDSDGSPGKNEWCPGKGEKDSTTGLHEDKFPDDPAASLDTDGDGCPDEWNPGKDKADSTSDPKLDLDSWPDNADVCLDSDNDNMPDDWRRPVEGLTLDTDDDNDGMPDYWEEKQEWIDYAEKHNIPHRFDPKNKSDGAADWDKDGRNNTQEYRDGTHPFIKDTEEDTEGVLGLGKVGGIDIFFILIIVVIIIVIILVMVMVMRKRGKEEPEKEPGEGEPEGPPEAPAEEGRVEPGEMPELELPPTPPEGIPEPEGEPLPPPEGIEEAPIEGAEIPPEGEVEGEVGAEPAPEPAPEEPPAMEPEAEAPTELEAPTEPTVEEPAAEPQPEEQTQAPEELQFQCPVCNTAVTKDMSQCPGCQSPLVFD